jgi:hypothetical protein
LKDLVLDLSGEWVGSNFGTHPGNVLVKVEPSSNGDGFFLKIFLNSGGISYGAISHQISALNVEVNRTGIAGGLLV